MRTIGAGNSAQPTSTLRDFTDAVRIEVANASDVLTDLTQYAASLEYESSTDEIVDAATIVFRRNDGASSLAPLMTASPPIDIGRRVVVSINPGSGTYKEVFRGQIDEVDWPERNGDVTIKCRDRAGIAADTWVEDAIIYSTTAGVSLETVMQGVVTDNLATVHTLNFPAATSAVVIHPANAKDEEKYGPNNQSVLDALRDLAESIGWTIRWRHFDASASDWKWTVFQPSRSKTTPDHTFGTSDYWNVTQLKQSINDIRNVVEVEYPASGGARARVVVEDAASIAAYGRRYMKISEPDGSPINTSTLATSLANAALSDLKDPDAILEIECRYFWPGEVGVDLYRFSANGKHFSSNQDLAAMAFRHRIAVGERPTTWITCRGKPSGGVLMWRRRTGNRLPTTIAADDLAINNLRETARTETAVTYGWEVAGDMDEIWVWYSTPAQPLASDVWAGFTGAPTERLTGATTSYTVPIPDVGLVTYVQLVPIGTRTNVVVRGDSKRFTVQGEQIRLIQQAEITATSATQCTVRVRVASPISGGNVTVTPSAVGCTISPTGAQTITAASVTSLLSTTGYVDYTVTRPAFQAGTGRVSFTASGTDRISDVDAVDIPAQERDTVELLVRVKQQSVTATQVVYRVAVADPVSGGSSGDVTLTYTASGCTISSPASPQTIASAAVTTNIDTTGTVDVTVDRGGTTVGRVTFTAARTGRASGTDSADVPALDGIPQATVAISSTGAVTISVDGAAWVASYKYATSTSGIVSDATAAAGTTVNGRQAAIATGVTLSIGGTVYATLIPYSATGAGGTAGSSISLQATRHDFSATKTVRIGVNAFTEVDPSMAGKAQSSGAYWQNVGYSDTSTFNFPTVGTVTGQTNWLTPITVPDGVTITNLTIRGYSQGGLSGLARYPFVGVGLHRIEGDAPNAAIVNCYTNTGNLGNAGTGWVTVSQSLSESTTGRRYQLQTILYVRDTTSPTNDGYCRLHYIEYTYTMPTSDKTI